MYFGKDDAEEDEEDDVVRRIKNTIYFYGEVNRYSVLDLIKNLKEATLEVQRQCLETGGNGRIFVHICSNGGCVFDGLAAMDTIASNPVPVTTVIEGAVCSAATFIALGGETVNMRPSAHLLIHQITSSFWGKYEEFNDEKKNLDKLMKQMKNLYSSKTNIPKKILSEMFRRDIYIDSGDCVRWNIVDNVL